MRKHKLNTSFSSTGYYMYGIHPVFCALNNSKRRIDRILCTKEIFHSRQDILSKYPFEIVTTESIDKIIGPGHNHQGIIAKTYSTFSNNLKNIDDAAHNCKIAILDQITDPQNIGAIIRSAAAFGIKTILLPQDNSPNENALIAKAACGALEVVNIIKLVNLSSGVEYLKKRGFWIIGLDAGSKQLLSNTGSLLTGKIAIVLGSEDKGLRRLTKEHCDYLVKIPIMQDIESLNVASAAAIIFYLAYNNI